jgi:hypothetical protein
MQSRRLVEWCSVAALFCITGCGQQIATSQKPVGSDSSASADTVPSGYSWFFIIPPERAYAADRTYEMGGPMTQTPGSGGYTYSLSALDPRAPLAKWRRIGSFQSKDECTNYRAEQLKQMSDPAWVSAQVAKSHHLVDAEGSRDLIESGRCISAAQLSGT